MPSLECIKNELRNNVQKFSYHKLTFASRFASELMNSLTDKATIEQNYALSHYFKENTDSLSTYRPEWREDPCSVSYDRLLLARTLFDSKELKRAAFVLKEGEHGQLCQSSLFLYHYALYLHGHGRKEEEIHERHKSKLFSGIKASENSIVNSQCKNSLPILERLFQSGKLDEMSTYLYGLTLLEAERNQEAVESFLAALNLNPCFWPAWQEILKLVTQSELQRDPFELLSSIKDHWMKNFYLASLLLQKVKQVDAFDKFALDLLSGLLCFFPNSSYLISETAILFYHKKDHDMSIQVFSELLQKDPYRLDSLETYSNILYVKDNPKDLGTLAYNSFLNNKYSPETNCIIGNYHSLMGEHEKAISYFKNALALDRGFLAAWTLIGHEYLELKRVQNAVDAYNHAVKVDNKDFRAWYGLGQAYELQNLLQTSIHYFLMAVKTRPRDYRMWNALASVYNKIDKPHEAVKCSERAENYKDDERIALFSLAKLYDALGMSEKAVCCFVENLNRIEGSSTLESDLGQTLLYLINYYSPRDRMRALEYAQRLYDTNGVEREQAQSIIHELNQMEQ